MQSKRKTQTQSVTMVATKTVSGTVIVTESESALFYVPSGFTSVTITFNVAEGPAGTFVALYSGADTKVSVTVAASRWYPVPASVMAAPCFQFVGNEAQAAVTKTIIVTAKS